MNTILVLHVLLGFALTSAAFLISIPLAKKYGWVDHPSSRRRHQMPMPMVGGVTVFFCWLLLLASYLFWSSTPDSGPISSYAVAAVAVIAFSLLGLYDDFRGASPRLKLIIELVIVIGVMIGVKEVRDFCLVWQGRMGILVWPIMAIWLVGVSNAVNLVDGLDGLAGGISMMILLTLAVLAFQFQAAMSLVLVALLGPCLLAFLWRNWSPAQVFLGDNGSLPLGFVLALSAVTGPVETASYTQAFALIVTLGYPVLDMGLCTIRRIRHKAPIFKADRGHLHHRFLRMGLSVRSVVTLIVSVTLYLQLCAFCIIEFSRSHDYPFGPRWVLINSVFLGAVASSLFYFLYFLKVLEQTRISRLSPGPGSISIIERRAQPRFEHCLLAKVHLEPLFESGLFEEKARFDGVLRALNFLVESILQNRGTYFLSRRIMHLVFFEKENTAENRDAINDLLTEKLAIFRSLYGIQYSAVNLRVTFDSQDYFVNVGAQEAEPLEARRAQ